MVFFGNITQSQKEAAYGAGEGIIWLDGVHCSGNETSLDQCLHLPWGQTDCKHQEDVGVTCSHDLTASKKKALHDASAALDLSTSLPADAILPTDCGIVDEELKYLTPDYTPKVVNGQDVKRGTIPWQASIRVRTSVKSVHWCGAVVISPLHILTAAHCLQDYTKSAYFVRVGDFDTEVSEGSEQELDIEATYIHEDFDKGRHLSNDLALVKLKGTGLRFSSHVRAVCLPPRPTAYPAGTNCTISGWGSNGGVGAGFSRRLRTTSVPIISEAECRAPYVYGDTLTSGMFCAGDLQGGSDSCQGDSGGPFVCPVNGRAVLYGVTSWGLGCGRPNKPGVYTKVASYVGWIHTKIHESLTGR